MKTQNNYITFQILFEEKSKDIFSAQWYQYVKHLKENDESIHLRFNYELVFFFF